MSRVLSLVRHQPSYLRISRTASTSQLRHFVRSRSVREDVNNLPSAEQSSTTPVEEEEDDDDDDDTFPDLMKPDPLLDSAYSESWIGQSSGRRATVTVYNDPPLAAYPEIKEMMPETPKEEEKNAKKLLPYTTEQQETLHKYPLLTRRVTQQTSKGKKHRQYMLLVVGNGNGLVGYGEGKHEDFGVTQDRALIEAVRNMDYVERFEKRTIWTDMQIKLGSTRILMRPRPVGFGLHCNPNVHQVLKAAGIKDVSAKVWGSRNPINVVKATCMLIQSGNAPLSMGNGIGGKGRRLEAGSGMRNREAIERERGRKLIDGRTY